MFFLFDDKSFDAWVLEIHVGTWSRARFAFLLGFLEYNKSESLSKTIFIMVNEYLTLKNIDLHPDRAIQ